MEIKYRMDVPTRRLSLIISCCLVAAFGGLIFLPDAYLRAWSMAMLAAVILLMVLSIPRRIVMKDNALEIQCIVELTRIPLEDIRSITPITREEIKPLLLLGSFGFFGYYGYFASLARLEIIKIYASELDNLVMIEDIYESKIVVSSRDVEQLTAVLKGD